MSMRHLAVLPLVAALALGGCTWRQAQDNLAALGTDVRLVAAKLDRGYALAVSEIPAGCSLAGTVGSIAGDVALSGALGNSDTARAAIAARGATALANSPICTDPQPGDAVATSLALARAVQAVRRATAPAGGVTAATAAGGS